MNRHRIIYAVLAIPFVSLLCQCESTDGSTPENPRIAEDRYPSVMPGMGGPQMIFGYGASTGSGGSRSGWMANPGALNGMGTWR